MTGQNTLEARIRRLEDRVQIQELAARYSIALDNRDMDALRSLFSSDARLQSQDGTMNFSGRDNIIEQLSLRMGATGPTNHINHSHIIEFSNADPDSATGMVSAHAELWAGGETLLAALRYSDTYRREHQSWCFTTRVASYLYFLPVAQYQKALGDHVRLLVRQPPTPADYPESLPTWRAFYKKG